MLLRAFQLFQSQLLERLAAKGHEMRAKHGAVLANLDAEGSRLTELARRAGMGEPALGELVDELEAMGYVRRIPDPRDRRAKLVLATERGKRAIRAAAAVIDELEAGFVDTLGESEYCRLRKALLKLTPHEDENIQPRFR